jgi:hypothetical protein
MAYFTTFSSKCLQPAPADKKRRERMQKEISLYLSKRSNTNYTRAREMCPGVFFLFCAPHHQPTQQKSTHAIFGVTVPPHSRGTSAFL